MSKTPSVESVFTPGGTPSVTYVSRDHLKLEEGIKAALDRPNRFTVVSGPTKSGKSVLCEKVLAEKVAIIIDGGQVRSAEEFWLHVCWKLDLPNSATKSLARTFSFGGILEFLVGLPATLQKKLSANASVARQTTLSATYNNVMPLAAISALRKRRCILIIEDFHYLDNETQLRLVRTLKSAVRLGLKVLMLAVPHRTFDPVEVETEVEGRVDYVEIPNWDLDDLLRIPSDGFDALGLAVPRNVQRRICEDGFGNPNVVQEACYHLAKLLIARGGAAAPTGDDLAAVYDRIVESNGLARFEALSHAQASDEPPTMVDLPDGGTETLNMAILGAVARLGPKPTTSLDEVRASMESLIEDAAPGDAVIGAALENMATFAADKGRAPIEWLPARRTLALTDPFLMFYLRWVLRDRRAMFLPPSALEAAALIASARTEEDGGAENA